MNEEVQFPGESNYGTGGISLKKRKWVRYFLWATKEAFYSLTKVWFVVHNLDCGAKDSFNHATDEDKGRNKEKLSSSKMKN